MIVRIVNNETGLIENSFDSTKHEQLIFMYHKKFIVKIINDIDLRIFVTENPNPNVVL